MQFVFFRPATAILSFVLEAVGVGQSNDDNTWAYFYSPQFFVMMIENVSVFLAFSGLLKCKACILFVTTEKILRLTCSLVHLIQFITLSEMISLGEF